MRFFLMQRNHPVAVIEIAEKTGDIIDVAEVLSAQRIPLGARHSDGSFDVLSLRKWWAGRGIPASRSGLEHALETLHIPYAELLLVKCSGLSLSDQYWVTPCDAPQNWRDVNFYENDFSDDVGRALFGEGVLSAQPDLCSPLQYLGWLFAKALAHCGRKTNPLKSRIRYLQARALQRNCCLSSV